MKNCAIKGKKNKKTTVPAHSWRWFCALPQFWGWIRCGSWTLQHPWLVRGSIDHSGLWGQIMSRCEDKTSGNRRNASKNRNRVCPKMRVMRPSKRTKEVQASIVGQIRSPFRWRWDLEMFSSSKFFDFVKIFCRVFILVFVKDWNACFGGKGGERQGGK